MKSWPWLFLLIAGLLEVVWAIGLKYTDSWSKLVPSLVVIATYLACLPLLEIAMKQIPAGTAYAVWVGIGTAGIAIWGIAFHGESASLVRLACLALILTGVIGLKLAH